MSEGPREDLVVLVTLWTYLVPSSLPCLTPVQDVDSEGLPGSVPVLLPRSGALELAQVGLGTAHMPRPEHPGWRGFWPH